MNLSVSFGCVKAAKILHNKLLASLLRAPMSFFDTTPLGRIINRFSKDLDVIDCNVPMSLRVLLATSSSVLTSLFIISFSTPLFLVVTIPFGVLYFFIQVKRYVVCNELYLWKWPCNQQTLFFPQRFYVTTLRQLRRIESILRSPIYSSFEATVRGAASIRAYKQNECFIEILNQLVDKNQMAYYLYTISSRCLICCYTRYASPPPPPKKCLSCASSMDLLRQVGWRVVGMPWKFDSAICCYFCDHGEEFHFGWSCWSFSIICPASKLALPLLTITHIFLHLNAILLAGYQFLKQHNPYDDWFGNLHCWGGKN